MKLKKYAVKKRIAVGCMALMMGLSAPAFYPAVTTVYADDAKKDENNKDKDKKNDNNQNGFINGDDIVAMARSYIGKVPYGNGKSLETSVDCAWFAGRIYEKFGINIYSTSYRYGYSSLSAYLYYQGKDIGTVLGSDYRLAQAGDLIVSTGHVAIATGKDTAISALNPSKGVMEHSLTTSYAYTYFGGAKYNGDWKIIRPNKVKATGVYNDPMKGMYQGEDYSAVFDFEYYYAKYPELATKFGKITENSTLEEKNRIASECLKYFVEEGMAKGEQASEKFNVEIYKKNYPDLQRAYGTKTAGYYQHYMKYGVKENRNASKVLNPVTKYEGVDYSAVYDFEFYLNKYSDIKRAFGYDDAAVLKHFVLFGMKEGRQGSSNFNVTLYKRNYPDLANKYGGNSAEYYMDYIRTGASEKKNATSILKPVTVYKGVDYSAVYDYNFYCAKYSDIKRVYDLNDTGALEHFVTYGMKEGRQGSEEFDLNTYKTNYPGLIKKYGSDKAKYYLDYMKVGKKYGRNAASKNALSAYNGVDYSAVYDFKYYQEKNPDIKRAFGDNEEATLLHFVKYGMKEGRQANAEFDVNSYWNAYSDLRRNLGTNKASYYQHYMTYGQYENRVANGVTTVTNPTTKGTITVKGQKMVIDFSPVYDYNYYMAKYPTLKAAFGNNDIAALDHFITYGMKEGRQAKETFNLQAYRARYADLRRNFGLAPDNNYLYYLHYIQHGMGEHRNAKEN